MILGGMNSQANPMIFWVNHQSMDGLRRVLRTIHSLFDRDTQSFAEVFHCWKLPGEDGSLVEAISRILWTIPQSYAAIGIGPLFG